MVVGFATVQLPVQNPCTTDRNPHLSYQTFLIPQPWKTDVLQIRALTSVSALKSLLRVPRVSKTIRRWWLWAMAGSGPGVTRSPLKCLRVGVPAEEQTSDLSISGWNQRSARLPLVVNYKEWDRRNQHCEVNLKQRQRELRPYAVNGEGRGKLKWYAVWKAFMHHPPSKLSVTVQYAKNRRSVQRFPFFLIEKKLFFLSDRQGGGSMEHQRHFPSHRPQSDPISDIHGHA